MGYEKLLIKIAKILENLNIKYFVTGGFAVSVWGRPRSTLDIDMVIKLIEPQVIPLARALRRISKAGYIDEQMMQEAVFNQGEFNFIEGETGAKVDFWVAKEDRRTLLELKRRIVKKINGQKVYFISPEDLILSKLKWYKESQSTRHLEDTQSILKISGEKLDMKYLKEQAEKLGLLEILDKLN